MKTNLKPQEYYYLYSPLFSDPSEMIKYTFQGLLVSGHITAYYRSVLINKRATQKRNRLFLSVGPNYQKAHTYSSAEHLIISTMENFKEIRLHAVINRLKHELNKDAAIFKKKFVYKDVVAKGYCGKRIFLTRSGKKENEICKTLIDIIDQNVDDLVLNPEKLSTLLSEIGSNLIFLNKITLDKINKNIPELKSMNFNSIAVDSIDFSQLVHFGSIGAFDDFSFDASSDFDGGDGGESGGGGSDSSW